jgi:hypothetical protein
MGPGSQTLEEVVKAVFKSLFLLNFIPLTQNHIMMMDHKEMLIHFNQITPEMVLAQFHRIVLGFLNSFKMQDLGVCLLHRVFH